MCVLSVPYIRRECPKCLIGVSQVSHVSVPSVPCECPECPKCPMTSVPSVPCECPECPNVKIRDKVPCNFPAN